MRLFVLAFLLAPALAAAQSPVVLTLRPATPVPDAPFSVARVVDLRADTSGVGEAKVGLRNRRRPLQLEGGAGPALSAYLGAALPPADGREPLVVGVDVLRLSEQTTAMTEFGRAEVHLRLFRERDGDLVEVGRSQALVEGRGMDVTAGHASRLVEALDRNVLALVAEDPGADGPALSDRRPRPDSTAPPALSLTDAAERSIRTFVSGGPILGANATGGRLGYGVRTVGDGAWSVPLTFEASVVKTQNTDAGIEGVFTTYGGTVQLARRLGQSSAYLQTGLQLSGGSETVFDNQSFFFGGRLGADLIRYPADRGLIVGLGVYGSRLFGSNLYPRDAGVSLTVGGQF